MRVRLGGLAERILNLSGKNHKASGRILFAHRIGAVGLLDVMLLDELPS